MKAIVTIVGKDQVGIIANVCSQLAACNINILEISQKIMDGFFTMMLVTDLSGCKQPLDEVSERYGFPTAAIVTMEEVTECLYNKEVQGKIIIDDALKAAIDSYYAQYGAKA